MILPVPEILIKNFKSLKEVCLSDCKRINLFIGKPNVGKSNLLEALSLFCLPHLKYLKKKEMQSFIRVKSASELFTNGEMTVPVKVSAGSYHSSVVWTAQNAIEVNIEYGKESAGLSFNNDSGLSLSRKAVSDISSNPFRSYFFPASFHVETNLVNYLLPPGGGNLMNTVSHLPTLTNELKEIFTQYDLRPVFDVGSMEIKSIREKENGEIFLIPFSALADTLQRVIFYKAAIRSNRNSVLLFEEPEAHSYPPYITGIVQDILNAATNQFFITTHSPYIVNALLESGEDEVAIYLVDMQRGNTVVQRLTGDEVQEIYEYGVDLFFNLETYLKQ